MGRAKPVRRAASRVAVEIDTAALRRQFRAFRAASGLSQAAAAGLLGLSQATVSDFERGKFAVVRAGTLLAVHALLAERWGQSARRRPKSRRVVVREAGIAECSWCGAALPRMERAIRFCPLCGGRQAGDEDGQPHCCAGCGRLLDLSKQQSCGDGVQDCIDRPGRSA